MPYKASTTLDMPRCQYGKPELCLRDDGDRSTREHIRCSHPIRLLPRLENKKKVHECFNQKYKWLDDAMIYVNLKFKSLLVKHPHKFQLAEISTSNSLTGLAVQSLRP